MMMRSPYARHYTPEYYSAAEVRRMADQLKHAAQVWQGRYEQSLAAVDQLQRELNRIQQAQANQDGRTGQKIDALQVEVEQLRAEADNWRAKFETAESELGQARDEARQPEVMEPETNIEQFILDVLPFVDNLERALNHADDTTASAPLRDGIALTLRAFASAIGRYDIERIPAEGQPFDPTVHEAVGVMPHPTLPAGTVAEVEQNGYRHGARLLRPARVMVAG